MLTPDEEQKKRELFEAMSLRRQQKILKKGYDRWDPFQRPKEPPVEIKKQHEEMTQALDLFVLFLEENQAATESDEYLRGVKDMCEGIIKGTDTHRGMYDCAYWYVKRGKNR